MSVAGRDLAGGLPGIEREADGYPFVIGNVAHTHGPDDGHHVLRQLELREDNVRIWVRLGGHVDGIHREKVTVFRIGGYTIYEGWKVIIGPARIRRRAAVARNSEWFLLGEEQLDMLELGVELDGFGMGRRRWFAFRRQPTSDDGEAASVLRFGGLERGLDQLARFFSDQLGFDVGWDGNFEVGRRGGDDDGRSIGRWWRLMGIRLESRCIAIQYGIWSLGECGVVATLISARREVAFKRV